MIWSSVAALAAGDVLTVTLAVFAAVCAYDDARRRIPARPYPGGYGRVSLVAGVRPKTIQGCQG